MEVNFGNQIKDKSLPVDELKVGKFNWRDVICCLGGMWEAKTSRRELVDATLAYVRLYRFGRYPEDEMQSQLQVEALRGLR